MDDTLVDGPNSSFFRRYIVQNPSKRHVIVTFRDEKWASKCKHELAAHGVPDRLIERVAWCPYDLWKHYTMARPKVGEWVAMPPQDFHAARAICEGTLIDHDAVTEYLHWKGFMSHVLGCTALVDDLCDHVIMGCQKHGIALIDSHDAAFGLGDAFEADQPFF